MGHNAMVSAPVFMEHLGPVLPLAESQAAVRRQQANLAEHGTCFWAVEERSTGRFVGYCGIKPGPGATPIAGEPEIGWGISPDCWRLGYAREAAEACLAWAWAQREWQAVYAITAVVNARSRALMERIGMARVVNGDFSHPALGEGDPLRRHVLYRIDRP